MGREARRNRSAEVSAAHGHRKPPRLSSRALTAIALQAAIDNLEARRKGSGTLTVPVTPELRAAFTSGHRGRHVAALLAAAAVSGQ
jgi:hypothetical protein